MVILKLLGSKMEYNKKEQLFDKINGLKYVNPDVFGKSYNDGVGNVVKVTENFFNKELIHEVPQYVADWYEEHKDNFEFSVWDYVYMFNDQEETSFKKWFNESKTKPFETLVNMHQFGYKVKKNKKYTVKMIGLSNNLSYLNYDYIDDEWYFDDSDNGPALGTYHTKKQLEDAGFSNVFDNPMFEVKEVE